MEDKVRAAMARLSSRNQNAVQLLPLVAIVSGGAGME